MKSLRSDLVLTVFSHLLTKPVWLIADNLIQDRLGHETYGLIGALHSYATWANVIADWSLSYHIARQIAQASHLIRPIAAQTLLPKLFLSLFTAGLFLLMGDAADFLCAFCDVGPSAHADFVAYLSYGAAFGGYSSHGGYLSDVGGT
jgi:hypothetical protein